MVSSVAGVTLTKRGNDVDLLIYQGKTLRFDLIWGGSDPIDVTDWDARMQLRPEIAASNTIASLTTESGLTVGGVDGKISVAMSADDTAALPVGSGYWDMELIDTDGNVYLAESGRFTVAGEVTR